MRSTFAVAALAAAAYAMPAQSPTSPAPAGCATTVPGTFQITVVNLTSSKKRSLERRDTLMLKLSSGVLTDQNGRVGSIVANRQFQFDPAPGQAGAIYTSGWSVCANQSLAIGGQTTFYQCLSGDFYNLYDQSQGGQCTQINILAMVSGASSASGSATATAKVTQIGDGQPQAVSQISDGQIQMATGKPVTQITDGQIQAPKSTGKPVSQISDGQIQAPTSTGAKVSQISDGQIQAATSAAKTTSAAKVSQISDGQIQAATSAARTTAPVAQFTGAAAHFGAGNAVAAVAGLAAAVALL